MVVIGGVVFRRILRFQDTGQVKFKRAEQAEDRLCEVRLEAVHIVGFNFAGFFIVFNLRLQQVLDRFPANLFVAAHHGDDAFEHSGKNFVNLQGEDACSGIFRARNVPADDVGQGGDRDQQVLNQRGQTVCIQEVGQRRQRLGQRCDRERGHDFNETEHVVRDILDAGFHALRIQHLLIFFGGEQVGFDLLVAGSAGNAVDVFQHGFAVRIGGIRRVRVGVVQNLFQAERVEQRDKDVRVAVHALDAQCTRIVLVVRILEQNQILACEQGCKDVLQRGDHRPDIVKEAVFLRDEGRGAAVAGDAVKAPGPKRGCFLVDLHSQLVFVVAAFQLRFSRANDRVAGLFAVFVLQDDERLQEVVVGLVFGFLAFRVRVGIDVLAVFLHKRIFGSGQGLRVNDFHTACFFAVGHLVDFVAVFVLFFFGKLHRLAVRTRNQQIAVFIGLILPVDVAFAVFIVVFNDLCPVEVDRCAADLRRAGVRVDAVRVEAVLHVGAETGILRRLVEGRCGKVDTRGGQDVQHGVEGTAGAADQTEQTVGDHVDKVVGQNIRGKQALEQFPETGAAGVIHDAVQGAEVDHTFVIQCAQDIRQRLLNDIVEVGDCIFNVLLSEQLFAVFVFGNAVPIIALLLDVIIVPVFLLSKLSDFAVHTVHVLIEVVLAAVRAVFGQQVDDETGEDVHTLRGVIVVSAVRRFCKRVEVVHDVRDDTLDTFVRRNVIRSFNAHVGEDLHNRVAKEDHKVGREHLTQQRNQQLARSSLEVGEYFAGAACALITLGRQRFGIFGAVGCERRKVKGINIGCRCALFRAADEAGDEVIEQRFKVKVLVQQAFQIERNDAFKHRIHDLEQLKHRRDQVLNRKRQVVGLFAVLCKLIHEVCKVRQHRAKNRDRLFKQTGHTVCTVEHLADTGQKRVKRGHRHRSKTICALQTCPAVVQACSISVRDHCGSEAVRCVLAVNAVVELILIDACARVFQTEGLKDRHDRFAVTEAAADGQLVGDGDRFACQNEVEDRRNRLQERFKEALQLVIARNALVGARNTEPVDVVGLSVEGHVRPGQVFNALAALGCLAADPCCNGRAANACCGCLTGAGCGVIEALRRNVEVDSSGQFNNSFKDRGIRNQFGKDTDIVVGFAGFRVGCCNMRTEQEVHDDVDQLVGAKDLGNSVLQVVEVARNDAVNDLGQAVFLDHRLERFDVRKNLTDQRNKRVDDLVERFGGLVGLGHLLVGRVVAVAVNAVVGKNGFKIFAELELRVPLGAGGHNGQQFCAVFVLEVLIAVFHGINEGLG